VLPRPSHPIPAGNRFAGSCYSSRADPWPRPSGIGACMAKSCMEYSSIFLHQCMIRGRQSSVRCPGRPRAAYLDPTRGTTFACQYSTTTTSSSTYRSTILTYCTYYCCSFDQICDPLEAWSPEIISRSPSLSNDAAATYVLHACSTTSQHNTTHHSPPCSLAPQKLYIPKAFNHHTLSKPWWSSF